MDDAGSANRLTAPPAGNPKPGSLRSRLAGLAASRWLRVVLVVVLLGALYGLGRLDFRGLLAGPCHWPWIALALVVLLPNYLLGAMRFHLVLRGMGASCAFRQTWRVTMYSVLGELVVPPAGAVDVVKAVAASRLGETGRARALAAALADRSVGFFGLVVFAALVCCLDRDAVARDARLAATPLLDLVCLAVCIASVAVLLALRRLVPARWKVRAASRPAGARGIRVLRMVASFFRRPWHLAACVCLAATGHCMWCLSTVALAVGLGLHLPVLTMLVVLPLVIVANTVNFAGGIGGGLIVLDVLLEGLFDVPRGLGLKLGLAIPLLTNLSRMIALPWFFVGSRRGGPTPALPGGGPAGTIGEARARQPLQPVRRPAA
jgi:hypothetical protein